MLVFDSFGARQFALPVRRFRIAALRDAPDQTPPNTRTTWPHWLSLVLVTLAGGALRFWNLDAPALWGDDAATWSRVCGTFQELLDVLRPAGFGPLHYELYWWITQGMPLPIVGRLVPSGIPLTPVVMRLVPAIAGTLMVPAMYALARQLASRRTALLVAVLTAFSAYLLNYSRDAKMYSHLWLTITLHVTGLLWFCGSRSFTAWLLFVLGGCAMLGLQTVSALVLAVDLLIVLTTRRQHLLELAICVASLPWVVLLPLAGLIDRLGRRTEVTWLDPIGSRGVVGRGVRWMHRHVRLPHAVPPVLPVVLGLLVCVLGPLGYSLYFNTFTERVAGEESHYIAIDLHSAGLPWVPPYNRGRDGAMLLRSTVSAFLTGWEGPRGAVAWGEAPTEVGDTQRFALDGAQPPIDPPTLVMWSQASAGLMILLAVGVLPWRATWERISRSRGWSFLFTRAAAFQHRYLKIGGFKRLLVAAILLDACLIIVVIEGTQIRYGLPAVVVASIVWAISCTRRRTPAEKVDDTDIAAPLAHAFRRPLRWRAGLWLAVWMSLPVYLTYCVSVDRPMAPSDLLVAAVTKDAQPVQWPRWPGGIEDRRFAHRAPTAKDRDDFWQAVSPAIEKTWRNARSATPQWLVIGTASAIALLGLWLLGTQACGDVHCWKFTPPPRWQIVTFFAVVIAIDVTHLVWRSHAPTYGSWVGLWAMLAGSALAAVGVVLVQIPATAARVRGIAAAVAIVATLLVVMTAVHVFVSGSPGSVWMPRYLAVMLPAFLVVAAILMRRLPLRPLRWTAIVLYVAINLAQFAGRVRMSEPPVRQITTDLLAADADRTTRVYQQLRIRSGNEPGTAAFGSLTLRMYLAVATRAEVSPMEMRSFSPTTAIDRRFMPRPVRGRDEIVSATKRDATLKRLIIWDGLDFGTVDATDALGRALGRGWKKTDEQLWTAYDHWTWGQWRTCRRRVYEKATTAPPASQATRR